MANEQKRTKKTRAMRKHRVRTLIKAKSVLPRLSVFRSAKHFYAQIIDDAAGKTLCSASDVEIKGAGKLKPVEIARAVGKLIAEKAVAKKLAEVVYDRGRFAYHGRVQAAAEGAREGGLKF